MRLIIVLIGIFFLDIESQAQKIKVDSILSKNKITDYRNQKLILIDFWATWCAPCLPATVQLEILQESVSDKVYMISMSDEKNELIQRHLAKKPIRLAVYSDYEKSTIKRFNIISRPYAVLIDHEGKFVWSGKPSDLTSKQIEKFHSSIRSKNTKSIEDILEIQPKSNSTSPKLDTPVRIDIPNQEIKFIESCNFESHPEYYRYLFCGTLSTFFMESMSIGEFQIKKNEWTDKSIRLAISNTAPITYSKEAVIDSSLKSLGLKINKSSQSSAIIEIKVKNSEMLWDTTQIDWGQGSPKFLLGTSRLQANNISIREMANTLSQLKNQIYVYKGTDTNLYDWDFTYEMDDLMKEELQSGFGISIEKSKSDVILYEIVKAD